MEIGEVLLHLLGGAGMEYSARSRFKAQAKEQAEQNRLSRLQERMLQGAEHGYGTTQGALGRKSTEKIEGERNIVTVGEGAADRELSDTLSARQIASNEKIENMRDATNRFSANLAARTQTYVEDSRATSSAYGVDKGLEGTIYSSDSSAAASEKVANIGATVNRHGIDTDAEVQRYGIDTRAERDRIRGRQESIIALTQIDATLATSVAEIGSEGVAALMDKNKYTLFTILQQDDPTLTLEGFEEMYKYVTGAWEGAQIGPTEDKDEQDLRFMFREEYMVKTGAMPPNETQYREHMWANLYIMAEIMEYPETMRMASMAYERQFNRPLVDKIKEIAEGEEQLVEDKNKPGFFESRGGTATMVSPMAFPYGVIMGSAYLLTGQGKKAKEHFQVWEALARGHTPATYLAAAARSRREGGKRSTMQILEEDYVRWMGTTTEKRKKSLADQAAPTSVNPSVTGAPDLLLGGE